MHMAVTHLNQLSKSPYIFFRHSKIKRFFSVGIPLSESKELHNPKPTVSPLKENAKINNDEPKRKQKLVQTILNCTASRREARSYLAKYALLESNNIYSRKNHGEAYSKKVADEVNITHNKAYGDYVSNVVTNGNVKIENELNNIKNNYPLDLIDSEIKLTETIRACIIKIDPLNWDDVKLNRLGNVLRTALDLGASPILVIEYSSTNGSLCITNNDRRNLNKIIKDIRDHFSKGGVETRVLDGCFEIHGKDVVVEVPSILGVPVFSGLVPIVIPTAVDLADLRTKKVSSSKITKAIVNSIAQLNDKNKGLEDLITVEKIVFVDNLGGVPSVERGKTSSHVLINLQQEFDCVVEELSLLSFNQSNKGKIDWIPEECKAQKLKAFKEMSMLLKSLPNATGIMTTPDDLVKNVTNSNTDPNPLIYSILTDRATQSSSLPVGFGRTKEVSTTVLKWGTPVHIITAKSLRDLGLESCVKDGHPSCIDIKELEKKNIISCSKLQFLLEDSFRRKFDWNHYMNRIQNNIAAIIFTSNYSAAAIVTYEPLSKDIEKLETTLEDYSDSWVPYLDKFAVLRAQQGEPGLADVVFKALLSQFSGELVWRSRKTNPVNKWYFERSVGTVGIENSPWRVFYTGWKNEEWDYNRIKGYISVCSNIEPSFIS